MNGREIPGENETSQASRKSCTASGTETRSIILHILLTISARSLSRTGVPNEAALHKKQPSLEQSGDVEQAL